MSDADPVWRLVCGDELLAELVVTDADFPWLNARVRPAAGFAGVRPLFDDELRRLEDLDEELSSGRPHIAASARWCVCWRRTAGQWLSSCSTSRVRTRGGDGVTNPSRKGKKSRNSLARICRAAVEAMRSWLRLQEYRFAIAGGVEPYDEQVEVAEVKVK